MILDRLKDDTAERHAALERQVDLKHRLRTPETYSALLAAFYGFYRPLEAALGTVSGYDAVGVHFADRRKVPALARDLAALGRSVADVPLAVAPAVNSLGAALGRMYVLEGATLGGQIISRMVHKSLGLTPDHGCAFFASYGDQVGPMWTAFRAALVRFAVTSATEDEVVAAAADTFDRLGAWLGSGDAP